MAEWGSFGTGSSYDNHLFRISSFLRSSSWTRRLDTDPSPSHLGPPLKVSFILFPSFPSAEIPVPTILYTDTLCFLLDLLDNRSLGQGTGS